MVGKVTFEYVVHDTRLSAIDKTVLSLQYLNGQRECLLHPYHTVPAYELYRCEDIAIIISMAGNFVSKCVADDASVSRTEASMLSQQYLNGQPERQLQPYQTAPAY